MDIAKLKSVPRRADTPVLSQKEIKNYLSQLGQGWQFEKRPNKIVKEFEFRDFTSAINFVNKVAKVAEIEGHHPNIYIHDYKKVRVELWTHTLGGLHQNDFILASKIGLL